ncbi:MAG: NUDIX hydrolase [Betaproteobacteria bacterium]
MRDGARAPEIFMVRRHEGTAFMGGAWVFPGGRVDAADVGAADDTWCDGAAQAAGALAGVPAPEATGFFVAAARELFEEAGVLLAREAAGGFCRISDEDSHLRIRQLRLEVHGGSLTLRQVVERERLRLALDALVPLAHWVTPPVDTRRFDTRFFAARVPPAQTPAHDAAETTHGIWTTAADAVARCEQGEIVLPPPTWTTLRELERFTSVDEALTWARRRRIVRREPQLVERDGHRLLLLAGDPLRPELAGDERPLETRFVLTGGVWRAERPRT